jgi:hypothetical protein
MKSNRVELTLGYTTETEIQPTVFESTIDWIGPIAATKQDIFQTRIDKSYLDNMALNGRFEVRSHHITENLDYAKWNGNTYKTRKATGNKSAHYGIIELGEML